MTDYEYIMHFLEVAEKSGAISNMQYRACAKVLDKYVDEMDAPDTWVEFEED